MQTHDQTPQQEQVEAFTVSGYGGVMNVLSEEELRVAMQRQLIVHTTFRVRVYRMRYTDTRSGEGIYTVVDDHTLIVEELGVCQGLAVKLLPERSLQPKEPLPANVLPFPDKVDRTRARQARQDVPLPQDDLEEERRCRMLAALPHLGDYVMIVIILDLLDDCSTKIQHEGKVVTPDAIIDRTHFSVELVTTYLTIVQDQQTRKQMEEN